MDGEMDTIFLVKPGFEDPAYPGKIFYCWHCALIEGVLASFSDLANRLIVSRIEWPKPRAEVIAMIGVQNQSVPLLVLGDGSRSKYQTGMYRGRSFIADKDAILKVLSEKHGFPEPHP